MALSDRVVHARVLRQRTERPGGNGAIYTVTTLAVLEDFTGVAGQEIEVWELGGAYGGEVMWIGGAVTYEVGAGVLVFLERGRFGLRSVAMGFSKFDVEALPTADGSLNGRLNRNIRDTSVVGGRALQVRERTLAEFRDLTSRVRGVRPIRNRAAELLQPEESATASFTLLTFSNGLGPRWTEADSGTAINWYMNNTASSPLTAGNGVSEFQSGLSAWTTPTSGSISLQYAGATNQAGIDDHCSGFSAKGVLTFEDPENTISGSTLAVGGGFAQFGTGGTVNGTTFNRFVCGYIVFQNAADLSPSFRESTNFARVLEHEIGHTIGLGHSDQTSAIMYFSCCTASTPTAPNLGSDDLAGLNFIYPAAGSPPPPACSWSISPTSASATSAASSGNVSVTTQAGCSWSAATNSSFLGVTGGASASGTASYTVAANNTLLARSGTLTIAGRTFTVSQAAATCVYTLTPGSATIGTAGGSGSVGVSASTGCTWTAVSNTAFLSVTAGPSGNGAGTVGYSFSSNPSVSFRVGTLTIAGQTFTVTQFGSGPTMTLDKPSLRYGAVTSGTTLLSQTLTQTVRMTQTGSGTVSWTAASTQPWLTVSPAQGTGSATFTVGIQSASGLASNGTVTGSVTLTLTGAGNAAGPVAVTLSLLPNGTSTVPFGVIDTPVNNATGVTGAVPFTGWGLDDTEVSTVALCRAAVSGEQLVADGRCGGAAQIFVGNAIFIDGARSDVQTAYPSYPRSSRGGWGFMVLTNMLPAQGNGAYTFYVYLTDRDNHTVFLGTRTITCSNATSVTPFGAIDTPGQGEVISGSAYLNFGWALTPMPKIIPTDGSTVTVVVDGAALGTVTYNNARIDISTLFPGLNNTNGAIGLRVIDTTALANGLHSIAWGVTDSAGSATGVGSRYFTVSNGAGQVQGSAVMSESTVNMDDSATISGSAPLMLSDRARHALVAGVDAALVLGDEVNAAPVDLSPVTGRRGWNFAAPWRLYRPNAAGRATMQSEEIDRLEVWLGDASAEGATSYSGYLRAGNALAPLPIGSTLSPSGVFTWQPGVGFVGNYDLVFVRWADGRAVARHELRIVLNPKSSGRVGPQVVIDAPTSQQDVGQSFVLGGWAADLDAGVGTGIDTLHVWAYPTTGAPPVFVGVAARGARTDVAALHGEQFRDSGYGLIIEGLEPGTYDLAVFAWRTAQGGFIPAKVVRVTVR